MTSKRKLKQQIAYLQDQVWEGKLLAAGLRGQVDAGVRELAAFRRGLAWHQPPVPTAAMTAARNGDTFQ